MSWARRPAKLKRVRSTRLRCIRTRSTEGVFADGGQRLRTSIDAINFLPSQHSSGAQDMRSFPRFDEAVNVMASVGHHDHSRGRSGATALNDCDTQLGSDFSALKAIGAPAEMHGVYVPLRKRCSREKFRQCC